ncbi:adenine phosphoribosyltransferase [Helicobacter hepaticus]|jgi:adenine phosphoribosyltransferase|uniref:Adenine phosphoribosyltransferase n=1 Tax=Helicobacter hepaticus (strain ATCC 51449 / 3B1) TaxID=235279 RepID=APT_HELHP|nr:adenine phosphoribosyltransferase [Helicobacter hepaticus]Q7VGF2.1 RecName: Full=Adenine phosphoribosyltransferase; Short=APRT [Helicobacter hepaticus ATCC 51449]AAP77967.1 adenine phosphoribosyltransferase [Helicobacter hepaticus ATCC 51449]
MDKQKIADSIRAVYNYKPGVIFRDITTLIGDAEVFKEVINILRSRYENQSIDFIAAIEARGFIFGSALAYALGIGFVPIRKKGKLPYNTISEKYTLEYGTDELHIHTDAFRDKKNAKVVLIDDLIATGGTAEASVKLIKSIGAQCVEAAFVINLKGLEGEKKLAPYTQVFSIVEYEGK